MKQFDEQQHDDAHDQHDDHDADVPDAEGVDPRRTDGRVLDEFDADGVPVETAWLDPDAPSNAELQDAAAANAAELAEARAVPDHMRGA